MWRERWAANSGVTYSAYGDNATAKPEIWGSPKSGAVASDWELYDEANKIWRYKEKVLDQGSLYLDGAFAIKQIPSFKLGFGFVNVSGEKYEPSKELKHDLDMFCETTELLGGTEVPVNAYCLVPRGDGRGIVCTSEVAYVMVRGKYEIK